MAFGSWFKNIVKGASNLIGKIVPKVKKAVEAVGKFAPLISQAGDLVGGNVGGIISSIGNAANRLNDKISPKVVGSKPPLLGVN